MHLSFLCSGEEEAVDQAGEQKGEGDVEKVSDHARAHAYGETGAELVAENTGHGKGDAERVERDAAGGEDGQAPTLEARLKTLVVAEARTSPMCRTRCWAMMKKLPVPGPKNPS